MPKDLKNVIKRHHCLLRFRPLILDQMECLEDAEQFDTENKETTTWTTFLGVWNLSCRYEWTSLLARRYSGI